MTIAKSMRLLSLAALLMSGIASSALGSGLDRYKLRHLQRIPTDLRKATVYIGNKLEVSDHAAAFGDVKINTDNSAETFRHQFSAQVLLNSGDILVGWEDDRNGDFDIYAQPVPLSGDPVGANQPLVDDADFSDQTMLRCARSSAGKVAAVWVNEDGNLYLRAYTGDLSPLGDPALVNDNISPNVISYPDLAFLSDNRLVVIWEDTRLNSAIYGQAFDSLYVPIGVNFKISPDAPAGQFWSPGLAAGEGGKFGVVWEELDGSQSDVLFKLFDSTLVPVVGTTNVADLDQQSAEQFDPALTYLPNAGYIVGWSDLRESGQQIFAQLLDKTGAKSGVNFRLSQGEDNDASDLCLAVTPVGSALAVWTNFHEQIEIVAQVLNAGGALQGDNITVSDPAVLGERYAPACSFRGDGTALVSFTDTRDNHIRIYAQRLTSAFALDGRNILLSAAGNGAQQNNARIAALANRDCAIVWSDQRSDDGDIYLQRINQFGTKLGDNQKVNDDNTSARQSEPEIGSSSTGSALVVWMDERSQGGLAGVNIIGQRYDAAGAKVNGNFRVNDDPGNSLALHSEPDADIALSGKAVVAWRDRRNEHDDIYVQLYAANGSKLGANYKANQGIDPCFAPKVGIANNDLFVVAWRTEINNRSYVRYQLFNADGSFNGSSRMLPIDTAQNQQGEFDLAMNPATGVFAVAWNNLSGAGSEVYAVQIFQDGTELNAPWIISDFPDLGFEDISVEIDAPDNQAVAWSDLRTGVRRAYYSLVDRLVNPSGTVHPNQLVSANPAPAREEHPAVAMDGRNMIFAWADNRGAGQGFDVFSNSTLYNATAVEDDHAVPLPQEVELLQNFPNPFNPTTEIEFSLPSDQRQVRIEIFNLLGQTVSEYNLVNLAAGRHHLKWDASGMASGVYFYRLSAGGIRLTRKMLLAK